MVGQEIIDLQNEKMTDDLARSSRELQAQVFRLNLMTVRRLLLESLKPTLQAT